MATRKKAGPSDDETKTDAPQTIAATDAGASENESDGTDGADPVNDDGDLTAVPSGPVRNRRVAAYNSRRT